jgi:hypothetical protein
MCLGFILKVELTKPIFRLDVEFGVKELFWDLNWVLTWIVIRWMDGWVGR